MVRADWRRRVEELCTLPRKAGAYWYSTATVKAPV
jgi:hypothetical protein